jgi:membrane protease subunit HflC
MFHNHSHAGHDHHGHHHHDAEAAAASGVMGALRFGLAGVIVAGAVASACLVSVPAGEAVVVTRFGDPARVLVDPGLAWTLPPPIDATIPVDLRLKTTSSGQQDVGTRDGLRVLVQAYVAWQVPADADGVRHFLRSVRNQPDEAARQIRSFLGAALHITASSFDLADLVNTDPARIRTGEFETKLGEQIAGRLHDIYGIDVRQVGIERLSLPAETLSATVARMRAERETVAAERTAEGLRQAAAIRADAERDARIQVAAAHAEAAGIEAAAQKQAATIHARAFNADPKLYLLLRSLDTVASVIGANSRLVLRTDAAPFNALVDGPPTVPSADSVESTHLAGAP